jgi:PGDYG protein
MLTLTYIDLTSDPQAAPHIKNEVVQVRFAEMEGELMSREGPNRYTTGDALITGSTGDQWCVSRNRFDQKYSPVSPLEHGIAGQYRNCPLPVLAKQMLQAFTAARSTGGDILSGAAGDWLVQYAPGDYGVVESTRFKSVYRPYNRDAPV